MLSESDAKRLFQLAAGVRPASCIETANGRGLASEDRVRSEIAGLLDGCPKRTTTFAIAKELSVEVRDAIRLLPPDVQFGGKWCRLGESVLIGPTEFGRLKRLLQQELTQGIVTVREFVQKNEIDNELFFKLLPSTKDESWTWLDAEQTKVYSERYREDLKDSIAAQLNRDLKSCIQLSTLSTAPISFTKGVIRDLLDTGRADGCIEGDRFMTGLFLERLQTSARDELHSEGVVAISTLREGHIVDPHKWFEALVPEVQLLSDHFVSPWMIENIRNTIQKKVGWLQVSEIKDPKGRLTAKDTNVLWPRLLDSLPDLVAAEGFVVAKSLDAELLQMSRAVALLQAETDWRREVKSDMIGIARALFQYFSDKASLHPTLRSAFAKRLASSCHAEYQAMLEERQKLNVDAEMATFLDKFLTRFHIYRTGVDGLEKSVLKKELTLHLLQWARLNGGKSLEKVEAATKDPSEDLQMLRTVLRRTDIARPQDLLAEISLALRRLEPDGMEDIVSSRRKAMLVGIYGDVQSFKVPSLALLSTLTLLHATRSTGILKVTGQHVPKLIHEAFSVGLLSGPQLEIIKRAKVAVIGGVAMTPDDREKLQAIGKQCVGALGLL